MSQMLPNEQVSSNDAYRLQTAAPRLNGFEDRRGKRSRASWQQIEASEMYINFGPLRAMRRRRRSDLDTLIKST